MNLIIGIYQIDTIFWLSIFNNTLGFFGLSGFGRTKNDSFNVIVLRMKKDADADLDERSQTDSY